MFKAAVLFWVNVIWRKWKLIQVSLRTIILVNCWLEWYTSNYVYHSFAVGVKQFILDTVEYLLSSIQFHWWNNLQMFVYWVISTKQYILEFGSGEYWENIGDPLSDKESLRGHTSWRRLYTIFSRNFPWYSLFLYRTSKFVNDR